jgi:Fe-S cluster assembly protein SufB
MATALETVRSYTGSEYKYGFVTDVEEDRVPPGLSEDVIRVISAKKDEPAWMTDWRLGAYRRWLGMEEPAWQKPHYPPIDYQAISYFVAPKQKEGPQSLDDIDPEIRKTYDKLGIPIKEQEILAGVAVDYVFDSVSVATTFRKKLHELGVIFCSISEAVREHPELVQRYLGTVVPQGDNFFAALNGAVFSDGTFVYVPKGVRCPMELSTYSASTRRAQASSSGR